MGAIRVFYGNQLGYIKVMIYTDDDGWYPQDEFQDKSPFTMTDTESGIGCTIQVHQNTTTTFVNIYYQDSATGELQYWWKGWNLTYEGQWYNGNVTIESWRTIPALTCL